MTRGCTGAGCRQGRMPEACDCELSRELGVDPDYVIPPPMLTPDDHAAIARVRRWTLVAIAAGFALLGALLGISDARFTP